MFFEDRSTSKIGVAYFGSSDSKSPEQWAAHFGRKVIDGLIDGDRPVEELADYARLAGSFANIALGERDANAAHREELARGFGAIGAGFGGRS